MPLMRRPAWRLARIWAIQFRWSTYQSALVLEPISLLLCYRSPLNSLRLRDLQSVLADVLYEGYIENHKIQTERLYHHDSLRIPEEFNFRGLGGLSSEMVERLERAQPGTFGDARRVAGMTSAGLTALLVNLTVANATAT